MLLLLIVTESDWYKNSWHCVAVPVADMIFDWLHGERETNKYLKDIRDWTNLAENRRGRPNRAADKK